MGLRFRKSIKLGNGAKLNINKKIRRFECRRKGRKIYSEQLRTTHRTQAISLARCVVGKHTATKSAPTERPVRACTTPTNHSKWTVG